MPFTKTEPDVYFNTKIKVYPNGSTNMTVCSKPIFKAPEWEDRSKPDVAPPVKPWWERAEQAPDIDSGEENEKPLKQKRKESGTEETRDDSLKRAKDKCFDIAFCNDWDLFVTITFNPAEVDSFNASEVIRKLRVWLQNCTQRKGLKYLLIPELHKSGRIHCHALMNDVLKLEDSGKKLPDGRTIYNLPEWKYGFSTAIRCERKTGNLAYYVTKYITKGNNKIFGKFFWSSKNIVRTPEIVYDNMNYSDVLAKEFSVASAGYGVKYDSYFGDSELSEDMLPRDDEDIHEYLERIGELP